MMDKATDVPCLHEFAGISEFITTFLRKGDHCEMAAGLDKEKRSVSARASRLDKSANNRPPTPNQQSSGNVVSGFRVISDAGCLIAAISHKCTQFDNM
ncbi:MAG: hypothetical protein R3C59_22880 [Planctomycetaceae bacterium]